MNPYRVGGWVVGTDFYNRENLLQDILVGPADDLWIIGNRRVGKTSLLRTAEYKTAHTQYLSLFWDMQEDTSETQLVESLLEAVENAQGSEIDQRWQNKELLFKGTVSNISQALRHLSTFARQQNCRLLLLCDEIEGLNLLGQQDPHVLSQLRRSMQQNPNIRTVLASTRRLSRLDGAYQAGNIPLGQWLTTNPTHHSTQGGVTNTEIEDYKTRITDIETELAELGENVTPLPPAE